MSRRLGGGGVRCAHLRARLVGDNAASARAYSRVVALPNRVEVARPARRADSARAMHRQRHPTAEDLRRLSALEKVLQARLDPGRLSRLVLHLTLRPLPRRSRPAPRPRTGAAALEIACSASGLPPVRFDSANELACSAAANGRVRAAFRLGIQTGFREMLDQKRPASGELQARLPLRRKRDGKPRAASAAWGGLG